MEGLDKLFYWQGIAAQFFNFKGDLIEVPVENKLSILQAMGVDVSSDSAVADAAYQLDVAPWFDWLAPFYLVYEAESLSFFINLSPLALAETFSYRLLQAGVPCALGTFIPQLCPEVGDYLYEGVRYSRRAVSLASLPIGYYELEVSQGDSLVKSVFAVAPAKAYLAPVLQQQTKPWGFITQLYTLRSANNWGIGDFTDLQYLIKQAAKQGVAIIGLNPLHALLQPVADNCSPYSPSDRRFINPLYVDLTAEPDFVFDLAALHSQLAPLRASDKVCYEQVSALKHHYFECMYTQFVANELDHNTLRAQSFLQFVARSGQALTDFCVYQVCCEVGLDYASLSVEALQSLISSSTVRLRFHAYLQWLADGQLASCQALAVASGMGLGLMRDLAVGANGTGAEVLTSHGLFCRYAAVGAPPDPIAQTGQNWGLPPMSPAQLRDSQFNHYIQLLRTNMAHCGALRIDHAMSLLRLWWCPPGKTADFGAYVYYPFHEMLGLLKLESHLNQCVIVGEDMGVVPPELRNAFYEGNIFTNKLFYFEKNHAGFFKHPNEYEAHSLAMLTNHDVPTLASWWSGSDLTLRQSLCLLDGSVDLPTLLQERTREKLQLLEWLSHLGLAPEGPFEHWVHQPLSNSLCANILQAAASCASQLFVVQLEDLELMEQPVNVPGTSCEYPNWQRKLAAPLEQVFSDAAVVALLANIRVARRV